MSSEAPADAKLPVQRGRPTTTGLPKGVTGPLPKGGKYQARVSYKPAGISQRHLALFDTVEEAEAAIAGAIATLTVGGDPWRHEPVHKRQYKRGQVSFKPAGPHNCCCAHNEHWLRQAPPPERKTARRKGVITKPKKAKAEATARARGSDGKFESAANDENQDNPQYGFLPSSIDAVSRTCPPMSTFLLQDPGPWIALQAMDGSGELCP